MGGQEKAEMLCHVAHSRWMGCLDLQMGNEWDLPTFCCLTKYKSLNTFHNFPEVLTKLVNNRFLCCLGARKWNDGHCMYIIWVEGWRWHCKWRCGDFLLVDGCFLYKCWIRSLKHYRGSNINYILNYFFLFPQEFYGIDMWMLKKALGQLELKGKAQMFEAPDATDDSGQGVKFFS